MTAASMASVAPQTTVISRSGSRSRPSAGPYFAAMASRSAGAPQVMAYWFTSARIAAQAASLIACGAGKSGKPWARLMPSTATQSRVIRRMTDSSNCWGFAAMRGSMRPAPLTASPDGSRCGRRRVAAAGRRRRGRLAAGDRRGVVGAREVEEAQAGHLRRLVAHDVGQLFHTDGQVGGGGLQLQLQARIALAIVARPPQLQDPKQHRERLVQLVAGRARHRQHRLVLRQLLPQALLLQGAQAG